jgi:hypothetical protein
MTTDPNTTWIDGHPQLEAIAAAVWEKCERSDSGLVVDDPRNIAVAVLAAVLPPPADRAAVYREAADRLAAMYSDDDPAVENLRQWADDENEQAEAEGGCAHCGSSDHSWDECRAYTAAVADAQQEPPVHGESVAHPAGYQPDGRDTWGGDCCGAEPTDKGWIGDCWCTLQPGHAGEHRCQPCTDRHGAPGWTDEPAVDARQDGAQRCPAKHGALGRICELPSGHPGMHTGSGANGSAVWDGDAP